MKRVDWIGVLALAAALAGCDSRPPATGGADAGPAGATAKLDESAPNSGETLPPPDPAEGRYSPAYDRCLSSGDAAKGVTPAMAACSAAELAVQEAVMSRAFGAMLAAMPADQQPAFRDAQAAWVEVRAEICASENQTGGTIDAIGRGVCMVRRTARRAMELESMKTRWPGP